MREPNLSPSRVEALAAEPPLIPGYRLLRRIGRGSYGEVWLAQNEGGEYQAVKVVYRHSFERERPFEREFSGIQKFEPVSRSHPSQVSILQVGRDNEARLFYYAMELADDETSGRQIDPGRYKPKTLRSEVASSGRIPYDRALTISLSLTKALEHLHAHGLIHRDIKPSNIIFVAGVPKLADIGLVTDVGASISYVGTEGFLPPEGPVSQQADLYSLGKVLYEMSTGQDRLDFPELPTFLGESEEKSGLLELNLVFLKACQNDPQKRYRNAREMYADLALLRGGKSLKSARALERRLVRLTWALVGTALLGACALSGSYAWNRHRVRKLEASMAAQKRERLIAEEATVDKTRKLVAVYLANAEKMRRDGDPSGALAWLAAALREETDPARAAGHTTRILKQLDGFPRFVGFFAHGGGINSARFSGDGSRIVTAGKEKTVRIWDVKTGEPIGAPLKHQSPVRYAELSADNERVLTICSDGSAWLWKLAANETPALQFDQQDAILAGEFSPDGRFAMTRGNSHQVVIWDGLSARARFKLDHKTTPAHARYSPDGRHLGVTAGTTLAFWNTDRGDKLTEAASQIGPLLRVAFSPDSRRAIATSGRAAQLCSVADGGWSSFTLHDAANFTAAEFTPDNRQIIVTTEDGLVRAWDAVTGKPLGSQSWSASLIPASLTVSPDASALALTFVDHVPVIDIRSFQTIIPPAPHRRGFASGVFSPDARLVLAPGSDGSLWLSELLSGTETKSGAQRNFAREELFAMARLLSGREVNSAEDLAEASPDKLLADWRALKANSAFTPLPPEQWHAARVERLYSDRLWYGVRFHAKRLAEKGGLPARLREWDAKAADELARADMPATLPGRIPERSTEAPANLIDLTRFYNASLSDTWLPSDRVGASNNLAHLPSGLQKFNGVPFDVRGLIQLSGGALENIGARFPERSSGIPVHRKATNVHFLHGTAWDALYGTVIGKYRIHYANGEQHEVKLVFGKNVRDWWFPPTQPQLTMEAAVAWQGHNPVSRQMGMALRIFQYKWRNPLPDVTIDSIDFFSTMEKPAPFLLAITTEPAD